jgi:hypothetical protein
LKNNLAVLMVQVNLASEASLAQEVVELNTDTRTDLPLELTPEM